jgi:hypothetical protein
VYTVRRGAMRDLASGGHRSRRSAISFQSDRLLWNSGPMWQSTLSWFSSRLASKSKAGSMGRIVTGSLHGFGVVPATAAGFVISMCFNPIPNRVLAPRSLFETFWDLRS